LTIKERQRGLSAVMAEHANIHLIGETFSVQNVVQTLRLLASGTVNYRLPLATGLDLRTFLRPQRAIEIAVEQGEVAPMSRAATT
jgi:hypothetical protein